MPHTRLRGTGAHNASTADQTGLWGWSPPALPADTPLKRRVDRLLPRTGWPAALYFAGVIVALLVAGSLPVRLALALEALAMLAAGGWCALNFWRCRQAHCLITGVAGLALAGFASVEVALGKSLIGGDEALLFNAALAIGLIFEGVYYLTRGTNAIACSSMR